MKGAIRRKAKPQEGFEDEYRSCLQEYVSGRGEAALGRAYELGRRASPNKRVWWKWLHCITKLYWHWFGVENENAGDWSGRAVVPCGCLSPYEMAHRGFQDAVKPCGN